MCTIFLSCLDYVADTMQNIAEELTMDMILS